MVPSTELNVMVPPVDPQAHAMNAAHEVLDLCNHNLGGMDELQDLILDLMQEHTCCTYIGVIVSMVCAGTISYIRQKVEHDVKLANQLCLALELVGAIITFFPAAGLAELAVGLGIILGSNLATIVTIRHVKKHQGVEQAVHRFTGAMILDGRAHCTEFSQMMLATMVRIEGS